MRRRFGRNARARGAETLRLLQATGTSLRLLFRSAEEHLRAVQGCIIDLGQRNRDHALDGREFVDVEPGEVQRIDRAQEGDAWASQGWSCLIENEV